MIFFANPPYLEIQFLYGPVIRLAQTENKWTNTTEPRESLNYR